MSKNEITDKGVIPICEVIEHCTSLHGLFLHYNRILMKGGVALAKSLRAENYVQVFDISFNSIGGGLITKD